MTDGDIRVQCHTAATHMLMQGIPVATVSRILGHANPAITYRIYAHVIASMEADAVARIDAQYAPRIESDPASADRQ